MQHKSQDSLAYDLNFPKQVNQLINLYAFFMAFPVIVIFQNISVFIFILFLFVLSAKKMLFIRFSTLIQKAAVFFGLGAILSTIGSHEVGGMQYVQSSLVVLPNYIYWTFLIILLVTYRDYLNLNDIFRALTIGLFCSVIYFFFLQQIPVVRNFGIFRILSQNSFAYILICYTPIAVYYLKLETKPIVSFIAIVILIAVGFLGGSRSSSILVLMGTLLAYFITGGYSRRRLFTVVTLGILGLFFFTSSLAEKIVYILNPRTYELVYNTNKTFSQDKSYLVRRALVDKGFSLFASHPVTGVGLNNFAEIKGEIKGDFEGADLVRHKKINVGKSAHNSYISILAEGGILLTIPFAVILLTLIFYCVRKYNTMPDIFRPVFLGVLMMAIHLYFISAIVNVFGWFLLGLAAALVSRDNNENLSDVSQ